MRIKASRANVRIVSLAAVTAALLSTSPVSLAAESVSVVVDQAKLVKLPANVSTIVVGNPLIADVALQPGGTMVVTGKGYGSTNVVALDRSGGILTEQLVQVEGPSERLVTVYKGIERESYSCTPICQRRMTLGDSAPYFTTAITQASTLSDKAMGSANEAARVPGQ